LMLWPSARLTRLRKTLPCVMRHGLPASAWWGRLGGGNHHFTLGPHTFTLGADLGPVFQGQVDDAPLAWLMGFRVKGAPVSITRSAAPAPSAATPPSAFAANLAIEGNSAK